MSRRWRRSLVVFGAVVALVLGLGGGAAFAYFTSTSSGTGHATVGTVHGVTVVAATGTPNSLLQPGDKADLTLTLDNPNNSFSVTIVTIAQNGTVTVTGGNDCTASNADVSVLSLTTLSVSVPSGTTEVVHIANAATMGATSASGCQRATFHIPVTITVEKR